MFAFVLCLPVFALFFLLKNRKTLKNQILIKKYGVLYEEMKLEKSTSNAFPCDILLKKALNGCDYSPSEQLRFCLGSADDFYESALAYL